MENYCSRVELIPCDMQATQPGTEIDAKFQAPIPEVRTQPQPPPPPQDEVPERGEGPGKAPAASLRPSTATHPSPAPQQRGPLACACWAPLHEALPREISHILKRLCGPGKAQAGEDREEETTQVSLGLACEVSL